MAAEKKKQTKKAQSSDGTPKKKTAPANTGVEEKKKQAKSSGDTTKKKAASNKTGAAKKAAQKPKTTAAKKKTPPKRPAKKTAPETPPKQVGRKKTYKTVKALEEAIESYFDSISRTVPVNELVPTGGYTIKGYPELKPVQAYNDAGNPISKTEFVIPPSISALCLHLGISRQTWSAYCNEDLNPQFLDTTTRARTRVECYLEEELNSRQKGVQGIIFNLQHNYGWREKRELELSKDTRDALQGAKQMTVNQKAELVKEMMAEFADSANEGGAARES